MQCVPVYVYVCMLGRGEERAGEVGWGEEVWMCVCVYLGVGHCLKIKWAVSVYSQKIQVVA